MDDSQDVQDEKLTSNLLPRHRSPVFSKDEVKMLINIIDKYKTIILNKSTNTASCHAKEIAWSKITKTYNSQGFKHNRHTDSLKVKWDNLKKEARKFAKNVMDVNQSEFSDVISQIVGMMAEAENNNSEIEVSPEVYEDLKELENQKVPKENEIKFSDDNGDEDSGDDTMDTSDLEDERQTNHKGTLLLKKRLRNNRAMNFSPEESNLLLKCVRAEKKYVFRRDTTEKANKSKNAAWTRITEAYNRQSTQKRATKVLHTKFSNMKRMAKKLNIKDYLEPRIKRTKLFEENRNKRIKSEPALELDNEPIDDGDFNEIHNMDSHLENDNVEHTPDPLSTVLNGEDRLAVNRSFGRGQGKVAISNVMDVNQSEFSDVTSQIVGMMAEAENNNSEIEMSPEIYEDLKELENQKVPKENEIKFSDDNGDEDSGDDTMDTSDLEDKRLRNNRAMNFSPEESNLLLKCVRAEKKYVFRRDTTEKANKSKNAAWTRITEAYNRQSPQKRATKVLHTKFTNMKRMAKKLNIKDYLEPRIKNTKLFEENRNKRIKSEPALELDNEPIDDGDFNEIHNMDSHLENDNVEHTPDPLSTVLNGEDRLDTLINGGLVNPIENKEIVKLKMELIKYQIENAKLEKRRIEDAMRAEAASNEARCTETALRLRAARLDAIAAEMKLPPGHPALQYTAEETRAQAYINHYQT